MVSGSDLVNGRIIAHIDLDCFYCQVEQKRLNIPREQPVAVQQWDGLIAVNYAARALGVTRFMRIHDARKQCPEMQCVHVQTIGEDGCVDTNIEGSAANRNGAKACLQRYRLASGEIMRLLRSLLPTHAVVEKAGIDELFIDLTSMVAVELSALSAWSTAARAASGSGPSPTHAEPHLKRQETAGTSAETHEIPGDLNNDAAAKTSGTAGSAPGAGLSAVTSTIAGMGPDAACSTAAVATVGAGGADDSMADLTPLPSSQSDEEHMQQPAAGVGLLGVSEAVLSMVALAGADSVVLGGPLDARLEQDRRLAMGATIVCRLRTAVFEQLQYTMSGGVAVNKLLAKLGSSRNKPFKQTVLLPRGVPDLLQDLPIGKMWGMGGKLGASLETLYGAATAGQAQALTLEQLRQHLEDKAWWVHQIVRGVCTDVVEAKGAPKSLMSAKSFEPVTSMVALAKWVHILAEELAQRMMADEADYRRRAKTLVVSYRGGSQPAKVRSVRGPMPAQSRDGPSPATISTSVLNQLKQLSDALPFVNVSISATDFGEPPAVGVKSIAAFFMPAAGGASVKGGGGGGVAGGTSLSPAAKRVKRESAGADVQAVAAESAPGTPDMTNASNAADVGGSNTMSPAVVPAGLMSQSQRPACTDAASVQRTLSCSQQQQPGRPQQLQQEAQEQLLEQQHSLGFNHHAQHPDLTKPPPVSHAHPGLSGNAQALQPAAAATDIPEQYGGLLECETTSATPSTSSPPENESGSAEHMKSVSSPDADAFSIDGVSLTEQQRILRDIELAQLRSGRGTDRSGRCRQVQQGRGRGAKKATPVVGRQLSLTSLLQTRNNR